MRQRTLLVLLLTACASSAVRGENLELGLILGDPTGLSLKQWTGRNTAFDAALAWSFGERDRLHVHADYLFHSSPFDTRHLALFYGIGGRATLLEDRFFDDDRVGIGVRLPVGLDIYPDAPVRFFLEIAPGMSLTPGTKFALDGAVGIRYRF